MASACCELSDQELFRKIVFADRVSRKFRIFGMETDDCIQEGRVFLLGELLSKHPDASPGLITVSVRNHLICLYRTRAAEPETLSMDDSAGLDEDGDESLSMHETLADTRHSEPLSDSEDYRTVNEDNHVLAGRRQMLNEAIAQLPETDQKIIQLHFEQRSVRETAKQLNLSKSYVAQRIHRIAAKVTADIKDQLATQAIEAAAA